MAEESPRQMQAGGGGRLGRALATSDWAKPIRRMVNRTASVSQHLENIKATVQDARSKIARLRSEGYEVVAFEKGQERIQVYHPFRLHSYVILKMRKGDGEQEQIFYTRIEWVPAGMLWGPKEGNDIGAEAGGVLYPHMRNNIDVADSSTALRRLDRVIMEALAKQEQDRRFSVADFNSGHFANLVEKELQTPTPSALIPPSIMTPPAVHQAQPSFTPCKTGCGRPASEGFDTCCRTCVSSGGQGHGPKCEMERQKSDPLVEIVELVDDPTTCKNGCGRAAAQGYESCCRTCVESRGQGHGPQCEKAHQISQVLALYPTAEPLAPVPESIPLVIADDAGLKPTQPALAIEYLEATDANGKRAELWCRAVATQVQQTGVAQGHTVAKPPPETILGKGNYGCVWRAKDPRTDTFYAVKNMTESDAKREVQLFHHLHAKAAHPCIVRLYHCQVFAEAKLCTMMMELCGGGDLMNACQGERTASMRAGRKYVAPPYTKVWLGQVLLALEHLHLETECLIRDLKPANVLLDSGRECAKLADFGLGRVGVESAGAWTLGGPTGTPGYVSPEILTKERYDFRADLYSYGVLLWVMATGGITQYGAPQPPSNARLMRGGDFHVLNEDWRLLQDTVSKIDGGGVAPPVEGRQRDLILRLTARNPQERPDHAGVRAHAFFGEFGLPERGAPEDVVRAWSSQHIERMRAAMG